MICGLANNDRIDFSAYMKVYGEKALGHDPIDTLMLHVANRQIVTATPLIEKWVSGKYTPEEMKIWIE
jgi:hypothetical protein